MSRRLPRRFSLTNDKVTLKLVIERWQQAPADASDADLFPSFRLMAQSLRLPAPAKLNLMLHITGRRADGYHLLQTVFQFIDLSDWLEFELRRMAAFNERRATPVAAADDIVLAAASLLQTRFEVSQGVSIRIDKHIPIGGGLGGGSSDAASCLLALNRCGSSICRFHNWLISASNWVRMCRFLCTAERPGPAVSVKCCSQSISKSRFTSLSTLKFTFRRRNIFAAEELTRNCDPITIRAFLRGAGSNVCEPVVRKRHPQVGEAIDWLDQFGAGSHVGKRWLRVCRDR